MQQHFIDSILLASAVHASAGRGPQRAKADGREDNTADELFVPVLSGTAGLYHETRNRQCHHISILRIELNESNLPVIESATACAGYDYAGPAAVDSSSS